MKETMSNTNKTSKNIINILQMLENSGHGSFTVKELKEYFILLKSK